MYKPTFVIHNWRETEERINVAVGLYYDYSWKKSAPILVCKGYEEEAVDIVKEAKNNGIPMKEYSVLARALYDHAEEGVEIAPEFYQSVADVMVELFDKKEG